MNPYINPMTYKSGWLKDIIINLLNEYSANSSEMNVMDLGSGQGLDSKILSTIFKKVYSIEPSDNMLKWARKHKTSLIKKFPDMEKNLSKIRFMKGDFKNIPIKQVDFMLLKNTIHLSNNIEDNLDNIIKHISENGFLLIIEPTKNSRFSNKIPKKELNKKINEVQKTEASINKYITKNKKIKLLGKKKIVYSKNVWFLKKI